MEKNNKAIKKSKGTSKFIIFINSILAIAAIGLFATTYFMGTNFTFKMKILLNLIGEGLIVLGFLTTGMRLWVKRGEYFQGILLILGSIVITILGAFTFMNVFK